MKELLLVNLTFIILEFCCPIYGLTGEICGSFYNAVNYAGLTFNILDGENISDIKSNQDWGMSKSLKISEYCKLMVCSESHLNGNCMEITENIPVVPTQLDAAIASANCTCDANGANFCESDNLITRRRECARAYMNNPCNNSAQPFYTDLRKGHNKQLHQNFENKIRSLVVKKGCKLTTFGEVDEINEYTNNVLNFRDNITMYNCTCDESAFVNQIERNNQAPEFIEIPDTMGEITEMIFEQRKTGTKDRVHSALESALKSHKNKRSPKNAYIMLLGVDGAGRSSGFNLLFDNPIVTKIGGKNSTNNLIREFRIPINSSDLGISNSELRVINTPGLGVTKGLDQDIQDATFLSSLEEYLDNHEELNNQIPNIVLVYAKFIDGRVYGPGTNFVNMLKTIDKLRERITDSKFSNVIFVLSHFMSETRKVQITSSEKLDMFRKAITEYSNFPKPISIVFAENKAEDQGVPMVNGYFKLSNGDYYPKNLFDSMQKAALNGGDPIGEAIIREAFKSTDDFNQINVTQKEIVSRTHPRVLHYLRLSTEMDDDTIISDTEISKHLTEVWSNASTELQYNFSDTFLYMQRFLYVRNIRELSQVPNETLEIVKFLRDIEINEATIFLLETGLEMKFPKFEGKIITGYGYDLGEDEPLSKSPFDLHNVTLTEIGYTLPSFISCSDVSNEFEDIFNIAENDQDYMTKRMSNLGVSEHNPLMKFSPNGGIKSGYNRISNHTFTTNLNGIREYRKFSLVLKDEPELSEEFKTIIESLPKFDQDDEEVVKKWGNFFSQYGTHVISSSYGGGSFQINQDSIDLLSFTNLVNFFEEISIKVHIERSNTTESDLNEIEPQLLNATGSSGNESIHSSNYTLNFQGGNEAFHFKTFSSKSVRFVEEIFEGWRDSLLSQPIMLQNELKLIPYSQILKLLGQNYTEEYTMATQYFYNTTFIYKPTIAPLPTPRSRITKPNGYTSQFGLKLSQILEQLKTY